MCGLLNAVCRSRYLSRVNEAVKAVNALLSVVVIGWVVLTNPPLYKI